MIRPTNWKLFFYRCSLGLGIFASLGWGAVHRESAAGLSLPPSAVSEEPVAVFFSRPLEFDGENRGGPDEVLAQSIEAARCCVDVASYDFDLLSLGRALLHAHERGITVRVVVDSDHGDNEVVDLLRAEGIPVVGDGRTALMHDKFVVIDRAEVWAGSMNLTINDTYLNNNNLLRIRSDRLAAVFTAEFEEMFRDKRFGAASPSGSAAGPVPLGGISVEVLFAPDDRPLGRLLSLIQEARESIHFLAFSFTSDEIAAAFRDRARNGVTVLGVFESTQVRSNTGTEYSPLRDAGLDVRLDGNPRNMHHKVMILDGEWIVTGSYNFSDSAEKTNDEDLLILHDPGLADAFEREFQRVFELASP